MELKGKRIILGVTGSIAAYKAAYLLRLLVREGATVQVIMTPRPNHLSGRSPLQHYQEILFFLISFRPRGATGTVMWRWV
jgi:hypothetical protein